MKKISEYYQNCIQVLADKVYQPHFFVFSDDIQWAKSNVKINYPAVFVEHNNIDGDQDDFRLMRSCKYHIIANSSFSWWAAWLCSYPRKIVLAPQRWFNDASMDTKDLMPASWIRI